MPTWSDIERLTQQAHAVRTTLAHDQHEAAFRVRQVYAALMSSEGEIIVNDLVQTFLLNDSGGHLLTPEEKVMLGQPGGHVTAEFVATMQQGGRRVVQRLLAMQREAPMKLQEGMG